MRLLTPDDEPMTSEVIAQTLAYLTLWRGPLALALEPVGEVASLDNVITALALALVDTTDAGATADQRKLAESVLEQEQPNLGPADGLFYTLDQVKAHAAARQQLIELANQEGMDDD